jgi:hypothetical protein
VPAKLIYVEVARDIRQARADNARPAQQIDLARADAHSTEKDVHGALRDVAELVLDGSQSVETLVEDVFRALKLENSA